MNIHLIFTLTIIVFIFSSNGWKGFGGQDLFYINLNEITMKEPLNIGQEINTEGNENEIMLKKRW